MNKEINIDLRRCLKAILKKWWLIVIIAILCYAIAFLITINNSREDEYTAVTTVYSIMDHSALTLYSEIITSAKVSERASALLGISDMNANDIKDMISVKAYSTTLVLGISASSTNKVIAIKVANAVAEVFIEEVNNITSNNSVRLLDEATTAELSYNKQLEQLKFRIIVTLIGVALLCAWITIREIYTKKIHSLFEIGLDGELNIISIIPTFDKKMEGENQ
jgi:capsular polysaccharide biosynthesis protein